MKPELSARTGTVVSLHVHPKDKASPCIEAPVFHVVAEKGIVEDKRYFGRRNRQGEPSKRQVTLVERERLDEHAASAGLNSLSGGDIRSNIETEGVDLVALMGKQVRVGTSVLEFVEPRTPCQRMDAICQGLKDLMENARQGVIARVIESGEIRPGDRIELLEPPQP